MLVFPQLETKVMAIYPVERRYSARTVVNEAQDGRRVVYSDVEGVRREWELRATGLTGDEAAAVEALFVAAEGRLKTFTFLDPAGNLLTRSEEFSDPVWTAEPGLQFTPGQGDPLGTTRATRVINTGGAAQRLSQEIPAPGDFQYSWSVWARSSGGAGVTMTGNAGPSSVTRGFVLTAQWRRLTMLVGLDQATDDVRFGIEFPAGVSVDIFGAQAEGQPGASDYKRTGGNSGVFTRARFASDEITIRAQGEDVFDGVFRIETAGI